MKQLKTIPFFPFLLVLFFILHGAAENFGFIYLSDIIKLSLLILLCVSILFVITRFFSKNNLQAAAICFFISLWILFFGAVFDWVKGISALRFLHSYTVFLPLVLCTIVAFILLIRKKIKLQQKLCFYLNVLLLIYCLVDAGSLIYQWCRPDKMPVAKPVQFDTALVKNKPNVYFLLYDEYPGYKSLKDSFGYANDSLYHFLEEKEFKILPTVANYNMTFYCMSSMLNMQYINKPFVPLANTMQNDQQRIKEIKTPYVVELFERMGYSFTNYSIFDIQDNPAVKGNSFVVSGASLITGKILFNRLLQDIGWHFISGKNKIDFIHHIYMVEDRNNKFIQNELINLKPGSASPPRFIYAHFNLPHPPLFCDSTGQPLPAGVVFDPATYGKKDIFLSYLKYANRQMQELVKIITVNDPGAIVIVMSDHGYRNYKNVSITEPLQFDNFCALRLPNKNYLPLSDRLSNVNLFRYLFNCGFNQKMPYLPDSSIFLRDVRPNNAE